MKEEALEEKKVGASPEQKRYAAVLDVCMKIGLAAILVTFFLYMIGIPKPHVPVGDVSQYWGMKVDKYLEAVDVQRGWTWVKLMNESDFLNFGPIAFLAGVTVLCYASIFPILVRQKSKVFAILAVGEILVLVLAASGVLPSGGH
jgi:hypothetical protein